MNRVSMSCRFLVIAVLLVSTLLFHKAYTIKNNESSVNNTVTELCPPWTYHQKSSNTCSCLIPHDTRPLQCSDDGMNATLPYCFCFSYNERFNIVVVGYCVVRCHVQMKSMATEQQTLHRYRLLAPNATKRDLNRALCNDLEMNRTGQLCGSCLEGYTPPVYSYDMACVECSDYKYNWLKYIAVAYLPLTLFYIIVVTLRIPATSGSVNAFILTCQILTSPAVARVVYIQVITNTGNNIYTTTLAKVLMTIYGIWNLDFFRVLYHPFCLHPSMNTLSTLALDYAVAIYPLVLVVITYNLANIHDHSLTCVRLWRPFYRCFMCLRREWNIRTSLISTFATFILLSYVKILNTSLDLLGTTYLWDLPHNKPMTTRYLSIDGTIQYFGKQHLPYALLALFMLLLFNIVPLVLLCVYPCRCFQRVLNCFRLHCRVLNIFMDIFQGQFTTHPRDYRYFAAFYILLRMGNLLLISFANYLTYLTLAGMLMIISALLVATVRPYRQSAYNNIDAFLFTIIGLSLLLIPAGYLFGTIGIRYLSDINNIFIIFLICSHLLYFVGLLLYNILPQQCVTYLHESILNQINRHLGIQQNNAMLQNDEEEIPVLPLNFD